MYPCGLVLKVLLVVHQVLGSIVLQLSVSHLKEEGSYCIWRRWSPRLVSASDASVLVDLQAAGLRLCLVPDAAAALPVAPRTVFVRRHIASVKIFATQHPWILVLVLNLGYLCLCPQHTQGLHALDHWSNGDRSLLCQRLCSTWGSEALEWTQAVGSSCWRWTLCCDW